MKKISLILTSMLFLLVGGVFSQTVNLPIKGGYDWSATDGSNNWNQGSDVSYTTGTVTIADNYWGSYGSFNNIEKGCVGGTHWATAWSTGETHTFTVTLANDTKAGQDLTIIAVNATENGKIDGNFTHVAYAYINTSDSKTLTLDVTEDYAAVYICTKSDGGSKPHEFKITSITRTVTSGGGGGGSALDGKTAVSYGIPHEVNTAKYTYTFENGDNVSTTGFSSTDNQSHDDSHQGSGNLWLKNDSQGNAWDSQVYINLNSSEWPAGTKAILHFAMKSSTNFNANGESMEIAFQQNSEDNYTTCGIFSTGMVPTSEWVEYDLETTVTDAARCEKLYFNCGKFTGEFRFDDIILYKVEEAADGGSNVFTSDKQVANIASSAFSGLNAGDYICADVTGTPETIKLVCNGTDYALTQFNGGTLWGIKATADMVTALQANNSEFKGHDLTLNGINIYKTKTISESSDNSITKYTDMIVNLDRSFVAGTWNTVCLPFVPTSAQAEELFGSGYQLAAFTGVSGTTMQFTTITIAEFEAGKPYLVMPKTGCATGTTVLFDVDITVKNPTPVKWGNYTFTGTFTTKTFTSTDNTTSRFVDTGNELVTPNEDSTLKSLRCYFTVPVAAARSLSFDVDEEGGTTSINTVQGSGVMVNGYYNLAGQRVAQPTKGLYIVNGKKVVIK